MRATTHTPLALAAIVLTMLVATERVDAQSALETVKKRGKLVVGVKTDAPPFGTVAPNGKNVGFDVDIAHRLAKALFNDENQLELVAVTGATRVPFLQSEKVDIIIAAMTITDERRQVVEFSDPYFMSGSLLLVPKTSAARGIEDMAGKTVATMQASIQDKDVADLQPKANRIQFARVPEAVLAVKEGRADAHVNDDTVILALVKDNPDLKAVGKPLVPRPMGIAVRKGDTEFINWVNAELRKMRSDGTYDRLWKNYFADFEANLVRP
jgi:ABC-type amino acid transport substrate-binding protein